MSGRPPAEPPPAPLPARLHRKKRKNTPKTTSDPAPLFAAPSSLFCGACAGGAPPPPPLSRASFALAGGDGGDGAAPPPAAAAAASPPPDTVTRRHLRLRVRNVGDNGDPARDEEKKEGSPDATAEGDRDRLKAALSSVAGVERVRVDAAPNAAGEVRIECGATPGGAGGGSDASADPAAAVLRAVRARLAADGLECVVVEGGEEEGSSGGGAAAAPGAAVPRPPGSADADGPPPVECRSRLHVRGMCCSTETRAVRAILRPLPGVRRLGINVAARTLYVDHDPAIVSAALLARALDEEGLDAEVLKDGAAAAAGGHGPAGESHELGEGGAAAVLELLLCWLLSVRPVRAVGSVLLLRPVVGLC